MIYDISYETLIALKLLLITLEKVYGFIRIYDGTRYETIQLDIL